jgi:hypothetical protein
LNNIVNTKSVSMSVSASAYVSVSASGLVPVSIGLYPTVVRICFASSNLLQRPLVQIWREDGGACFGRLQGLAQRHMDVVARACDARSAVMLRDEPGGSGLAALRSRGLESLDEASGQFLAANTLCVASCFGQGAKSICAGLPNSMLCSGSGGIKAD